MVARKEIRQALLGRDVAVAYAIIVAFYMLKFVRFQPVQIPHSLLIVAYDFVEIAIPVLIVFIVPVYRRSARTGRRSAGNDLQ